MKSFLDGVFVAHVDGDQLSALPSLPWLQLYRVPEEQIDKRWLIATYFYITICIDFTRCVEFINLWYFFLFTI